MEDRERYKTGERLIAPMVATALPALIATVLMVVTAVTSRPKTKIEIEIVRAADDIPPVVEDTPSEPPEAVETPFDEVLPDIVVDLPPNLTAETVVPEPVPASAEPTAVRPVSEETVQRIRSVVVLKGFPNARQAVMRSRYTDGGVTAGNAETEQAVMKALRWLKKTQRPDGSWNGNPVSNTGLAILTCLAHGETPASREFGDTVTKALDYLIGAQTGEGDDVRFRGSDGNEYAFLIATYALCEAYAMTRNPNVRDVAARGLSRIVRNQSPTGGWDYRLNRTSTRDDMSFAGWALQALKAGRMAGLGSAELEECIKKAMRCLRKRNFRGGGFGYTAGGAPMGLTATGCLAMQLLGFYDQPEVKAALDYMRDWRPAFDKEKLSARGQGSCPQYYCYYASQCKYQAGMRQGATVADLKAWQAWNAAMKNLYPSSMITQQERVLDAEGKPCFAGYWKNRDSLGSGETMATCLCALQLMVYYRYLPTTKVESRPVRRKDESKRRDARQEICIDVDI